MKIAVTGADQGLARKLCNQLAGVYELIGWGQSASAPASEWEYKCVDLGRREEVEQALVGLDALVHAAPFDPPDPQSDQAEAQLLDWVARGTYGLVMEAAKAGIGRLVLISRLSLLEDYPEEFLVGENWMPRPRPEAAALAPYAAELVGREVARTGRIEVVCLRLGAVDAPGGTSTDDAVAAVREALEQPARQGGHCWNLRHVASTGRFVS